MSDNQRYIVQVTRRRIKWLPYLLTVGEVGPFTYQKALTVALAARNHSSKTFVKAVIYTAIKQMNGPGSLPGSHVLTLFKEHNV